MKNILVKILLIIVFIGLSHLNYVQGQTRIKLIDIKINNQVNPKIDLLDSLAIHGQVVLDYKNSKRLHFDYKIDSLIHGESIKYKIEGFDADWINCNNFKQLVITNLDPGNYDIKVGIFNDNKSVEETWFHLIILPPFWKTFWFKLIQVLFFGGIILTLYFQKVRLKRKIETRNK